ncbi:hypothetical protein [Paenibacillus montanisoli]|uniref:Uncharacterized protein n=1 Tax=Paenibacillus montanisoli TaxID=2081970 RepID=A0A328TTA9_9BACL|nr:hypothetical protein [Paenibacillus montanisoli]RAP73540.1 hypothetical protein DL346_24995 [Paenibacillus montanisoli]
MMMAIMYVFFVVVLLWIQFKLMKKTAQTKDYVTVGLILSMSVIVGVCLTMGIPLMSPTMMLEKWLSAWVK